MPPTLATPAAMPPEPRWQLADAWRGLRWQHLGLAALIAALTVIYTGTLLRPGAGPGVIGLLTIWTYHLCQFSLPLVLGLRICDRAVDRGASALLAYGLSVPLVVVTGMGITGRLLSPLLGGSLNLQATVGLSVQLLFPLSLAVAAYAHWRQEQRSKARLHARRLQAARDEQELRSARLLALQARVDPQQLFDSLQRIAALAEQDPVAADAQLAEMIALLRAMSNLDWQAQGKERHEGTDR